MMFNLLDHVTPTTGGFIFGLPDKAVTVSKLRDLIERVESEKVVVVGVSGGNAFLATDFAETTFSIRFCEKAEA